MPYVNLNMRKEIVQTFEFAPIGNRSLQRKWDGGENISASVVDPLFQEQRDLGKIVGNVFTATHKEALALSNEVKLLADNEEMLCDHLDARICAFFRQLVDVYAKEFVIEEGKVEDQLKSSEKLFWTSANGKKGSLSFESAHYGTLPCLIGYPKEEYEIWQANPTTLKPAAQVINKYSDTYHYNNACAGHLKIVNEADSLMDWKGSGGAIIRPFSLQLLNAAANKQIDPISGTRLFIGKLTMTVQSLLASHTDPSLQIIFQTYKAHLAEIREMLEEAPHDFFSFLLGIKMDENDPLIQKLRDVIYPHRFQTMQTMSECQSQLAARVEVAKGNIVANQPKPKLFDQAFKAQVILSADKYSKEMSKVFQSYFCLNLAQAQQAWDASYTPAKNKVLSPLSKAEINSLFADTQKLLHNYSIDLSLLRANLLKQLRMIHQMTQKTVAQQSNAVSPLLGLYQQQISRLELGQKKISEAHANAFSQVFGVHRSVFIADAPMENLE